MDISIYDTNSEVIIRLPQDAWYVHFPQRVGNYLSGNSSFHLYSCYGLFTRKIIGKEENQEYEVTFEY